MISRRMEGLLGEVVSSQSSSSDSPVTSDRNDLNQDAGGGGGSDVMCDVTVWGGHTCQG